MQECDRFPGALLQWVRRTIYLQHLPTSAAAIEHGLSDNALMSTMDVEAASMTEHERTPTVTPVVDLGLISGGVNPAIPLGKNTVDVFPS